jgi:hypothetical protein
MAEGSEGKPAGGSVIVKDRRIASHSPVETASSLKDLEVP